MHTHTHTRMHTLTHTRTHKRMPTLTHTHTAERKGKGDIRTEGKTETQQLNQHSAYQSASHSFNQSAKSISDGHDNDWLV